MPTDCSGIVQSGSIVSLFWSSPLRPAWVGYGVALFLVAVAAFSNYLMPPVYGESHYFFFSAAILASALFSGLGPGLLATAVSALVSAYLFIAPLHSFRIEAPEAAQRLTLFIVEGALISSVGHVIRNNRTPELLSTLARYGAAVVLVSGAAALKVLFLPTLERHVPFTFFYSAVVATAWAAGAAPGLAATVLSAAWIYYLYFRSAAEAPGNPALLLFAFEATGLCLLTAIFRHRLVETEAHLGRVFENCPIGMLILDRSTQILKANPAFHQILRADKVRLEGRSLKDLTHPDSLGRVRHFLDDLIWQQTVSTPEEVCLALDATTAWTNLRGSPIQEDANNPKTCLVMVEDVTERRKAEEALREIEVRLERGQRIEAIGMFAGGIAHDFNNLLAVIFGCCERQLFQKDLPSEARACTEEILQTAKTAADLTSQLLAFARRQPRSVQMIPVNRLVTESAPLLQRLLGPRIDLKTNLAPEVGRVRADPVQLQQILMNLAANARDAMPTGGRLTIQTATAKQFVTLRIADTGHGMDETTRARIFEPLFSTKDLKKGTGLGLATVHRIVAQLGGTITVESSPGHGACFLIYLPGADPAVEESLGKYSASSNAGPNHS